MRTALITGATRGIGRAIAERLKDLKFNLILVYKTSGDIAAQMIGSFQKEGVNCIAVQADVSKEAEVEKLVSSLKGFPAPDTLVNNAGLSLQKLVTETSAEEYQTVMDTNFKSVFLLTRAFVPKMVSARFGRVVNISSMWGLTGASMESVYSASKAAVIGFTKGVAKELAPCGITVNCIAPGLIDTDMNANLTKDELDALIEDTPLKRIGKPADIAYAVEYLVKEDCFVTGATLNVSGGLVI